MLLADFPITHRGCAGVEHRGQHGLTEFEVFSQRAGALAVIRMLTLRVEDLAFGVYAIIRDVTLNPTENGGTSRFLRQECIFERDDLPFNIQTVDRLTRQ